MIGRLVAYIIGSMVAVLAVGTIFRDRFVTYESETAVLIFGIVLGLLTAYVKPVLGVISFHDVANAVIKETTFHNRLLKSYIKNWPEAESAK